MINQRLTQDPHAFDNRHVLCFDIEGGLHAPIFVHNSHKYHRDARCKFFVCFLTDEMFDYFMDPQKRCAFAIFE